jgi:hypothetical protein
MRRLLLLASAILSVAAAPLLAQDIGTVASTEPTLRGTPPGAATRALTLGTDVVRDETVQSSATGRGQLLFLDQTTLSLAPNTTIVLDRFVFDPDRGTGEIGLQLTEGALRFIGGTLSRQQDAVIRTPTSTIGIRGSSALILHQNGRTIVIFIAGNRVCVEADGERNCTSRQGGVLTEDGYQGRVAPGFLAFVLGLIDGAPVTAAQGAFGGGLLGTGPGGTPGSAGQGQSGAGVVGAVPPGSNPASPDGAEYDTRIYEDGLTADTLRGLIGDLSAPPPTEEQEGGGDGPPPPPPGDVGGVDG